MTDNNFTDNQAVTTVASIAGRRLTQALATLDNLSVAFSLTAGDLDFSTVENSLDAIAELLK
jgi:hypothetical protein